MRVHVYYNLNRHVWSVRDPRTRRVIDHRDQVHLADVRFVVSEAGRQRVLRRRCRSVHPWAEGVLCERPANLGAAVRYNPYRAPTFEVLAEGSQWQPIHTAALVGFAPAGRCYLESRPC